MSRIYRGERINGECFVSVDGRVLNRMLHVRNHSPSGFEWGYGGSGPAQLALAILCSEFGIPFAEKIYQRFKLRVIGRLNHDAWELTSAEIKRQVDILLAEKPIEEPRTE